VKTKIHPKASAPNFWANDYKETKRYETDQCRIIHYENSGGREKIEEHYLNERRLPSTYYPGGGCSSVNGTPFCSFGHIDWQIPTKRQALLLRFKRAMKKLIRI